MAAAFPPRPARPPWRPVLTRASVAVVLGAALGAGSTVALWPAAAGAAVTPAGTGAEAVELYYFERPPYVTLRPGGSPEVGGLTATPAAQAFKAAGIAFRWVELPTMRQLVTLKDQARPACAVGWFRNPEREQQFKFTRAIYRDRATVGIARSEFTPATTLAETLRQPRLQVLVKDGFSYGAMIDGLLTSTRVDRVVTSADNVSMVHMVEALRAQFMFAAEEEATYLVEQARLPAGRLKLLHFGDLPPGERRHILCSKATPDELIERLNRAITFEAP